MKKLISLFILLALLIEISLAQVSVDLNKLLLNDTIKISELNVEIITNILGRPSAVKNNEAIELISDLIGNQIFYHELGLSFWFYPKKQDSLQRVWMIDLYMSRRWDENNSKFYMPFTGTLTPNLSANTKLNDLLPIFQNDSAYICTAREKKDFDDTSNFWMGRDKYDSLILKKNGCSVAFNCEEITKYLEDIIILFEEI